MPPVTFVINYMGHGGAGTQVYRLSKALAQRGAPIRVISLLSNRRDVTPLLEAGVRVEGPPKQGKESRLAMVRRVRRALRSESEGVLVAFLFHSDMMARMWGPGAGYTRIISSIRNEDIGGKWREVVLRLLAARTDELVTNSAKVARGFEEGRQLGAHRIRVIPNGLPLNAFRPPESSAEMQTLRAELGEPSDPFVWITVGEHRAQKNYLELLRAFTALLNRQGSTHQSRLWIVGPERPDVPVRAEVARLELENHVRIWGARDDVPRLLKAADAFVLASRHEGLPNALIEAQATGLPAVGTDVGGVAEIIQDPGSGRVVPPSNPSALTEAMLELASLTPDERGAMSRLGRQHVRASFALDSVVDTWLACINGEDPMESCPTGEVAV